MNHSLRIGITGAHSTGKTTLLNALRSEPDFKNFVFRDEVTRKIRSYGLEINENGSDVTQRLIMKEHAYNLLMYDHLITDRTTLDCMIYTDYLHDTGKVSRDVVWKTRHDHEKLFPKYNIILYTPVEFEVEDDGVRSTDAGFRRRIAERFEEVVNNHKDTAPWIVTIKGSVRERVNATIRAIQTYEGASMYQYMKEYKWNPHNDKA
jgi:nicotinamide riboside kinase